MKAVVCRQYGGPEVARLEDVPAPAMVPGGVRIRVRACSASFASILVMEGKHQNRAPLPLVAGTEVAGEVIETDSAGGRFKVGDRVIACVQSGGYAEQVVAPESTVFDLPDGVTFEAGCHFPTIYATAYAGLEWRARVQPGETVLVHGAAGGSGLAAVEVAKALGARVIATVGSTAKAAAVSARHADVVINYREQDWREAVLAHTGQRGADVIYDPVGGDVFNQSLRCIAPEGRLITMGFASGDIPSAPANHLLVKNVSVIGLYWGYYVGWGRQPPPSDTTARIRAAFARLLAWAEEGVIQPTTASTCDLAEFGQALAQIRAGEVIGRIVMRP